MSKTVRQIAESIGVSKQAVMKCIDNLGLRETLTKNGNLFMVGDSQEKAIRTAFLSRQSANQNDNQAPTELATVIDTLRSTINSLQGQLETKDDQIKTMQAQLSAKDEQISQLTVALQQQTSALESTTAALTAAQALHAADKRSLMLLEDKDTDHRKPTFWERRAAKKAAKKVKKAQLYNDSVS